MTSFEDLQTFVDFAVDYAEDKTEGIVVHGIESSRSQIRFSQSAIDINKRWRELKLEIFLILKGAQIGSIEQSVSNKDEVRDAINTTLEFTKILPESQFFAGIEESVREYAPVRRVFDEKIDEFTVQAPEIVNSAIDAAVTKGAKRVAGALRFGRKQEYFRSSYGPEGTFKSTSFDLNVRAFQDELDYSGQGLHCGTMPTKDEERMVEAGAQAGRLSKEAIGAEQGEPGKYDLILSPTVAADIIAGVPGSANPFLILIGLSPLGDRMGEEIAPDFMTVTDHPHIAGALGSHRFDFEGTPTREVRIVENGILKSLVHNTTTAMMYETKSTGSSALQSISEGSKMLLPGNSNIVFEAGDHSFEELIDGNKPTIYVTCNWYTRFQNYQTGEFSTIPRDAMFLVKNGEMTPIKNLRISDNLMRMFANIEALGKDLKQILWWEVPTPTFVPYVRVSDCTMTAATQ